MKNWEIEITREGGTREVFKNCTEQDFHLVMNAFIAGKIKSFYATEK